MPGMKGQLLIGLLSAAFILGGGGVLAYCLRLMLDGHRSEGWPRAEGVITSSGTRQGPWSERAHEPAVYASIRYEFAVGGSRYASDRVHFGALLSNSDKSALAAKYTEGKRVPVAYDPADPKRSVLETGAHAGALQGAGIGAVFALIGCGLLYGLLSGSIR